jgi:hypothetical protein
MADKPDTADPAKPHSGFSLRTLAVLIVLASVLAWVALRGYAALFDPKVGIPKEDCHSHERFMRDMRGLPPLPPDTPPCKE